MVNQLFFAFFEFLPLLNGGILLRDQYALPLDRSNFTPVMYEEFIEEKVETLAMTGAKLIIVSTVEESGRTFYIPTNSPSETSTFNNPYSSPTYSPEGWYSKLSDPRDFYLDGVKVLLDKASELGLKVVLGTGRNGDKPLMSHIYHACVPYNTNTHPRTENPYNPGGCRNPDLINRWLRNRDLTYSRMDDLDAQYGDHPAMAGFYLTHETNRFRATMSRYYIPAADHAKSLKSDYLVVTSPSYIFKNERTTHKNLLDELQDNGIDALMYQDRMGAGVVENGSGVRYTYNTRGNSSNTAIDTHLYDYLDAIHDLHDAVYDEVNSSTGQNAGKVPPEMWINMESWRLHCLEPLNGATICPDNSEGNPNHSPYYPASASTFQRQINIARQFGPIGTYEITGIFQKPKDPVTNAHAKFRFVNVQRTIQGYESRARSLTELFD